MANTQSMCTSFLSELMLGQHQLGASTIVSRGSLTAPTTDTLKAALYLASATINAGTTAYSATGEVTGTGYTAGGVTVTNATAPTSTNSSATAGVGYWTPSASITYSSVTIASAFDTVLIYNSTQSNKAISVHTFTSQTITAGTLTLTMPSNTTSLALIRLSTT
jgi:hypothetical protein